MDSNSKFTDDLKKYSEEIKGKAVSFQKAFAFELFKRLVLITPVDTGRARGAWGVSVGDGASIGDTNPDLFDKSGQSTIANGTTEIGKLDDYGMILIYNPLSYINLIIEEGRSKQAPVGAASMVLNDVGKMFGFK